VNLELFLLIWTIFLKKVLPEATAMKKRTAMMSSSSSACQKVDKPIIEEGFHRLEVYRRRSIGAGGCNGYTWSPSPETQKQNYNQLSHKDS